MLIICVFQRAEIVWACSGNPLRLVTSLSAFLLRGNGQRHTGYQETELTSEWWAADVSFPQVSARILHRSTSLSAADQTATQVMMLIVTTAGLQLFILLSLSQLFAVRNRKGLVLSSAPRVDWVPGKSRREKGRGLSFDWGRRGLCGFWTQPGPRGTATAVPKGRFPNVSFYELLGSIKLPFKAVFKYCLLLLDRHCYLQFATWVSLYLCPPRWCRSEASWVKMEKGITDKMQVYITKDCSDAPALVVNIPILGYAHCGSRQCLHMVAWPYCLLSTEFSVL